MIIFIKTKNLIFITIAVIIVISVSLGSLNHISSYVMSDTPLDFIENDIYEIFMERNSAILDGNKAILMSFYDTDTKLGLWAYQHQYKKMMYLHQWADKQGIEFTKINSTIKMKQTKQHGESTNAIFNAFTQYYYEYIDEIGKENSFSIGTYHSITITEFEYGYKIAKEWYTDPFADSLHLDNIKSEDNKSYILSQGLRDFSDLHEGRKNALEYSDIYCGALPNLNNEFDYNKKYKNYNSLGGDCANFASQVLFEGGKFKKNSTWNYDTDGSRSWVNANALKDYLIYSGRGSLIVTGDYNKVLNLSYKLLPGDIIGYEKKGKVVHVSVIAGADSKGYTLVNCHNTDRYRVPWDLGWSNKSIKFWLIHVNY